MKKRVVSLIMALNVIMTGVNITTPIGVWAEGDIQNTAVSEIADDAENILSEENIPESEVSEETTEDADEEVFDEADEGIRVINGEEFAPNGELLSRVDKSEGIELFAMPSMSASDIANTSTSLASATYKNITDEISSPGEMRYYKYGITQADTYVIETIGEYDTVIYLFDENGNCLTSNDDNGEGRNSRLEYSFSAKTYYVGVCFYDETLTGDYDILSRRQCTVTYNLDGGVNKSDAQTALHGDFITLSDVVPKRASDTFGGWLVTASGSETNGMIFQPGDEFIVERNTTLTAQWNVSYTIKTDTNGGSGKHTKYTASFFKSKLPLRFGYTFMGWKNTSGELFNAENEWASTSDGTTLTAQWEPAIDITTSTQINDTSSIEYKNAKRFYEITPQKSGTYVFEAEDTSNENLVAYIYDSEGTLLSFDTSKPTYVRYFLTQGKTYYAVVEYNSNAAFGNFNFSLKRQFNINYDANSGIGAPEPQVMLYGDTFNLSDTIPEKTGYEFLGWAKSSGATEADYQPGEAFVPTVSTESTTTLYAVWRKERIILGNGSCGSSAIWTSYDDGELAITGTGNMESYSGSSSVPWASLTGKIKKITIANGITNISRYAFSNCSALTSVSIPASVTAINYYAFYNCDSITSITVPAGVKTIGEQVFMECDKLTAINVASANTVFSSQNGVLFDKNKTKLICYPKGKSGVYTVPSTVVSFESRAFYNCTKLTGINLTGNVAQIPMYAFEGCTGLTSLVLPNGVTVIAKYAFRNCKNLKSIVLNDTLTEIKASAFTGCTALEKVYFRGTQDEWNNVSVGTSNDEFNNAELIIEVPQIDSGSCGISLTWILYEDGNLEISGTGAMQSYTKGNAPWYSFASDIVSVTIKNDVTSIGNYAFYGLNHMTNAVIPGNVQKIGSYAFEGCTALETVTVSEGVKIIDGAAFKGCTALSEVALPQSITSIGSSAFISCTGLTYFVIPQGVTTIGSWAFSGCTVLESIIIPASVKSIGNNAFYNCNKLHDAVIPYSVEKIGTNVFMGCSSLVGVSVAENNAFYSSKDGVLFDKNGETLIFCPLTKTGVYNIPLTVKTISANAFNKCTKLKRVLIPSTVTSIEASAFSYCSGLTNVMLPEGITKIEAETFYNCSALLKVSIPASVKSIGDKAFLNCSKLTDVYYSGVESEWNAITMGSSNTKLTNADIYFASAEASRGSCGDNASWILYEDGELVISGVGSMKNYSSAAEVPWSAYVNDITSITITPGITTVGAYAFANCSELTDIIIPEGVTLIGNYAFTNCSQVTFVSMPATVTQIDAYAFSKCTSLEELTLPENTDKIGACVFSECTELKNIVLPDSITIMGGYLFDGCVALENIELPEKLTSLGNYAFKGCSALKTVSIAKNVSSIGTNVFFKCTGLLDISVNTQNQSYCSYNGALFDKNKTKLIAASVGKSGAFTVPETVTVIDSYAFYSANKLTAITLPAGITTIGGGAFSGCIRLEDVYYYGTSSEWNTISIGNANTTLISADKHFADEALASGSCGTNATWVLYNDGELTINGKGEMSTYSTTSDIHNNPPWYNHRDLIKKITISNEITKIGEYAFYECSALENVVIPDGVVNIGAQAFSKCTGLKKIEIPESVTFLGTMAFNSCTSLSDITLPSGISAINGYTFTNCDSLTEIEIPENVKTIATQAFYDCDGLKEIVLSKNVSSIGEKAFSDCNSLEKISVNEENSVFSSKNGMLFNKNKTTLICAPSGIKGSIIIPQDVVKIEKYASINNKNLKSVVIPATVTEIAQSAFHGCSIKFVYYMGSAVEWNEIEIALPNAGIVNANKYFSDNIIASESCGTDVMWSLYNTGELVINGNGKMTDYSSATQSPWYEHRNLIKKVTVNYGVTTIGSYSFANCNTLKNVELSESVTVIGTSAFNGCSSMNNITIPKSVTNIKNSAFNACSALENIIIPNNVVSVGTYAFNNCSALTNVEISASVNHIGDYAFNGCSRLNSLNVDSENTAYSVDEGVLFNKEKTVLIKYPNAKEGVYRIPSGVEVIKTWAFIGCRNITGVVLPASIKTIESKAFYGCNELNSVYYEATANKWNSVSVGIDNNSLLDSQIYYNVTNSISGNCTKNVEWTIYNGCDLVINGNGDMKNYSSVAEVPWSGYSSVIKSVTVNSGITSIGSYVFSSLSELKKVTISSTVTRIGGAAFKGCVSLENIVIPENVANIDASAFYGCSSLKEVSVPDGITALSNYVFSYCTALENIELPETITMIGESAFYECSLLSGIELPNRLTSIGNKVFYGCETLENIVIPPTVTSIGNEVFSGCNRLERVIVDEANTVYSSLEGVLFDKNKTRLMFCPVGMAGSYIIPETVTHIDAAAFIGCSNVTSIILSNNVKEVGKNSFSGCKGLKNVYYIGTAVQWTGMTVNSGNYYLTNAKITYVSPIIESGICGVNSFWTVHTNGELIISGMGDMPNYSSANNVPWKNYLNDITKVIISDNMTSLGNYAFSEMTNLIEVIIPDSVTKIGTATFRGCTAIKKIIIPNGVNYIGARAFYNCSSLESIKIPELVTTINKYLFTNCTSLNTVTIPVGVEKIDDFAFMNCDSIIKFSIPKTVKEIGKRVFCDSDNLSHIAVNPYNEHYSYRSDGVLYNKAMTELIAYPKARTGEYKISEMVEVISDYAFYNANLLESITIPTSLTNIGEYAFYGCTALENAYYLGSSMGWENVQIGSYNGALINKAKMNYSKFAVRFDANGGSNAPELQEKTRGVNITLSSQIPVRDGYEFLGWSLAEAAVSVNYQPGDIYTADADITLYAVWFKLREVYGSGSCGNNLKWNVYDDGELEITGSGNMNDFSSVSAVPWYDYRNSITYITMSDSITSIGKNAFNSIGNVSEISVPAKTTVIGESAFQNCTSLTEIKCSASNTAFTSQNGVLFNKAKTQLIAYPAGKSGAYTIPSTVTDIARLAFAYSKKLTSVIIPQGVTVISAGAFRDCTKLASVTIPESVNKIDVNAFYNTALASGTVAYKGSERAWNSITVGTNNDVLNSATVTFGKTEYYTVTYNYSYNGGTSATIKTETVAWKQNAKLESVAVKPNAAFVGWNTDSDATTALSSYTVYSNTTLYAIFRDATKITYNYSYNGGTSATKSTDYVSSGLAVDLTPTATKSGWTFVGWNTSPTATTKLSSLTVGSESAITLYAIYKRDVTVNFYSKDNRLQTTKKETIFNKNKFTVTLPVPTAYSTGWTAKGWRYDTDAKVHELQASQVINVDTDTTLYAIYSKSITLSYNKYGGTSTPSSQTGTQYYNSGSKTSSEVKFTLAGAINHSSADKRFNGWKIGSSGTTLYQPGASISIKANTTMYATWVDADKCTITFKARINGSNQTVTKKEAEGSVYTIPKYSTLFSSTPTGTGFMYYIDRATGEDYHVGETITITSAMVQSGITLNCQFTEPLNVHYSADTHMLSADFPNENVDYNEVEKGFKYKKISRSGYSDSGNISGSFEWTTEDTTFFTPSTEYECYAYEVVDLGDNEQITIESEHIRIKTEGVHLTLSQDSLLIYKGKKHTLTASINVDGASVKWSSSNTKIVSVNSTTGVITANKVGTATITAKVTVASKTYKANCFVEVKEGAQVSDINFSEWNLAMKMSSNNGKGNNGYAVEKFGANVVIGMAGLSRWDGPVLEEKDKYPTSANATSYNDNAPIKYHVQNMYMLPTRVGYAVNNNNVTAASRLLANNYVANVKNALIQYGAVYAAYYNYTDSWATDSNGKQNYYNWDSGSTSGGHAITIVGWDDNYSKYNFVKTPYANGAFICKNSYGTSNKDDGYFYMSYYDAGLGIADHTMVFPGVGKTSNYDTIYEHDPYGAIASITKPGSITSANVFEVNSKNEKLEAVSFYTHDMYTSYNVYVIKNFEDIDDLKTLGKSVASGTLDYAGYHTVNFSDKAVNLGNAGDKFAVVVKLRKTGYDVHSYIEVPIKNAGYMTSYSNMARASAGESYIHTGIKWIDLTSYTSSHTNANNCIKAFTTGGTQTYSIDLMSEEKVYESDNMLSLDEAIECGMSFNPAFIEYINNDSIDLMADEQTVVAPSIGFGNYSFVGASNIFNSSYNLKNEGYVTSVKNQGTYNTCWAHAIYASLESCMLKRMAETGETYLNGGVGAASGMDITDFVNADEAVNVSSIMLNYTSYKMARGSVLQLEATVLPSSALNKNISWISSDPDIAEVDIFGNVTAISNGTVTITAQSEDNGEVSEICEITVADPVTLESISLGDGTQISGYPGDVVQIPYLMTPTNSAVVSKTWKSTNEEVAVVDEDGYVTLVGSGTADIKLTIKSSQDKIITSAVTVTVYDEFPVHIQATLDTETNILAITPDTTVTGMSLYVGDYNAKGKLIGLVKYGEKASYLTPVSANASYYKVFVWDSNMTPLAKALKVNR